MSTSRYHAVAQHAFRQAVIHLLENQYKLLGSHRVIQMIADHIAEPEPSTIGMPIKHHLGTSFGRARWTRDTNLQLGVKLRMNRL